MEHKYFYCYSYNLMKYLTANNVRYLTRSKHEVTGKKYWVFEGSVTLNHLLKQWRLNK